MKIDWSEKLFISLITTIHLCSKCVVSYCNAKVYFKQFVHLWTFTWNCSHSQVKQSNRTLQSKTQIAELLQRHKYKHICMPFNILNSLSVFNSLWEVQTVYFHVCLLPWLIDYFLFPLQWHMQVNAAQREPWVFVASFSLNLVIFSLSLSFCCFVLKEVCLTITSAFLSAFF